MGTQKKFAILITTRNRKPELVFTLDKIRSLLNRTDVECIIYDDGSDDRTFEYVSENYKSIQIFRNEKSRGLIYGRNRLLEKTTAEFAISIDDDLHFITENPLEIIGGYFDANPHCSLISFRIFWSRLNPTSIDTTEKPERIKSFAGGAHAIRMSAWNAIPDYPEWFVFYGEESFAAFQLFKKNMEIHYLPQILVHHRVDTRRKSTDYAIRSRRSLRSGWYLYFLFFPVKVVPKKITASIWSQLKVRLSKGEFGIIKTLMLASFDIIVAIPKIIKYSNRLTDEEYQTYMGLPDTKFYWKPEGCPNDA